MSSLTQPLGAGSDTIRRNPHWVVATVALAALLALTGCADSSPDSPPAPGEYTVEVTLTGGTGRASLRSPTKLTVTAATMTAEIVWSSPYYSYLELNGTRYHPTSPAGADSAFELPVTLDTDIAISAETTAMSRPHVIDYTLRLDSQTLQRAG
jgi:iron complex transport system substrate-binding protein